MTEEQIERAVCARTDRLDTRYMARQLTTEEYEAESKAITQWAERALATRER